MNLRFPKGMSSEPKRRTPVDNLINQSKVPQCGQGASPNIVDGSMHTSFWHTGHSLGLPSGVLDEMIMPIYASSTEIKYGVARIAWCWQRVGNPFSSRRWRMSEI